jgi:hypothetical protein
MIKTQSKSIQKLLALRLRLRFHTPHRHILESSFNIKSLMRITSSHTSYIPTSRLTFHFALAQSKPKGDFANMDYGHV